jgi:hypothetical protein
MPESDGYDKTENVNESGNGEAQNSVQPAPPLVEAALACLVTAARIAGIPADLDGRKMGPKERRGIAIALYEQYGWGYGRIGKAIGDNNKSNVQRWITVYKKQQGDGDISGGGDGETEVDMICGVLERGLKKC